VRHIVKQSWSVQSEVDRLAGYRLETVLILPIVAITLDVGYLMENKTGLVWAESLKPSLAEVG